MNSLIDLSVATKILIPLSITCQFYDAADRLDFYLQQKSPSFTTVPT
jgi:hypothetical protein